MRIKFTSLPFQRHGSLDGRVETVATDPMPISDSDPQRSEPIYYAKASVSLDRRADQRPRQFHLPPGMPLIGVIVVGRRPLYTYFIYPLQQTAARALRENQIGPQ